MRADDATQATAWTPATGRHEGLTLAVVANREPRRSAGMRDKILAGLRDGLLPDPGAGHRGEPGVTLVGGGPGHPDLVTVAARKALARADVVVADRLAPRELLDELAADVELVDVAKLPRGRAASQEAINAVIVDRARAGKHVVRFKGGDGFVFGRGYEEVQACAEAGVPCTVVPGVSSALSVPALAGIPVTHRGVTHDFTVVSGHLPPGHADSLVAWSSLGRSRGTLVLLMAVDNLPRIAATLQEHGRPGETPVAIVCDGSMPTERTVLTTLAGRRCRRRRARGAPPGRDRHRRRRRRGPPGVVRRGSALRGSPRGRAVGRRPRDSLGGSPRGGADRGRRPRGPAAERLPRPARGPAAPVGRGG